MLNNEDLLAISNLLDVKLKPVQDGIVELKMAVKRLETRMDNLETEVHKIHLKLENDIVPRMQNVENCYVSTYERYSAGADQIEGLQANMQLLKGVAAEHGTQLQHLADAM